MGLPLGAANSISLP